MKIAEAFKRIDEEANPDDYDEELPSLNCTLTKMLKNNRYVFSADFLARGYAFDRMAAEKMWRIICLPEEITERDVALCIFRNNPEILDRPEAAGIWRSQPVTDDHVNAFPHMVDLAKHLSADSDSD